MALDFKRRTRSGDIPGPAGGIQDFPFHETDEMPG
jgi:hypothetical protein